MSVYYYKQNHNLKIRSHPRNVPTITASLPCCLTKKNKPNQTSKNITWVFPKKGVPPHCDRVFHYKPSILGYPYFSKHPHVPRMFFSRRKKIAAAPWGTSHPLQCLFCRWYLLPKTNKQNLVGWLVVEPPIWKILYSQIGSLPQVIRGEH